MQIQEVGGAKFGHVFDKWGLAMDPEKTAAVKACPQSADKSSVKSFLHLFLYFY